MASITSLSVQLTSLVASFETALASLLSASALAPPAEGISLFDTKNELLLSYLHNLVFLIILKLRAVHHDQMLQSHEAVGPGIGPNHWKEEEELEVRDAVTKKLIEHRIYLEKGVRPLETKLRYQIDKLIGAANEADAPSTTNVTNTKNPANTTRKNDRMTQQHEGDISNDDDENTAAPLNPSIPDLAHRPNPSAFTRANPRTTTNATTPISTTQPALYKPPRIHPTALPTTNTTNTKTPTRAPRTSHTLNDYIREELADAPLAEPSIGAGSHLRGRAREVEQERTGYEEERLVRLPEDRKMKKMRKGRDVIGDGRADLESGASLLGGIGGVDFGKGKKVKRGREGGGGGGAEIGEAWRKRVKRDVGKRR